VPQKNSWFTLQKKELNSILIDPDDVSTTVAFAFTADAKIMMEKYHYQALETYQNQLVHSESTQRKMGSAAGLDSIVQEILVK
jgi:hypothetical protein